MVFHGSEVTKHVAGEIGNITDSEKQTSQHGTSLPEREIFDAAGSADSGRRKSSGGIWGSWRNGSVSLNGSDNGNEPTSGYQKASRGGRSMKVLKPSKAISAATSNRSSSAARTGAFYEPAPQQSSGESRRKSHAGGADNVPLRWESKRSSSDEQKAPRSIVTIARSSNPVGGASAFAWMNPSKPKATTAE